MIVCYVAGLIQATVLNNLLSEHLVKEGKA